MLNRSDREKSKTAKSLRSRVCRHARRFLVLAVVAAMFSGNLLAKVKAAAGDLDTTFSADGKLRTNFGADEFASAVAIQSDGKIVVVGYVPSHSTGVDFALARYNSDGTLDTTFSDNGRLTTDISGSNDFASAIAIQSDGKILVAGTAGSFPADFALVRYNVDGTLDTTFDGDGKVTTDFGFASSASSVAIQPNGKIVLGGSTASGSQDFALARYNTNGALDTSFSGDGKQTTDLGGPDYVAAVAIQSNGRIVAAGGIFGEVSSPLPNRIALARYTNIGALDTSFSGDGKLTTSIGEGALANDVAIQSDGKIVAAGFTRLSGNDYDFALVRYNANGSLDDGSVNDRTPHDMFGTNGIVTTDFFGQLDFVNGVAIQSDGKIVAAGGASHTNSASRDFGLARYNIDGTPDNTFSDDGKQTTNFFSASRDDANAIAIQADGKIVVAGTISQSSRNVNFAFDFGVARYLGD